MVREAYLESLHVHDHLCMPGQVQIVQLINCQIIACHVDTVQLDADGIQWVRR